MRTRTIQTPPGAGSRPPERPSYSVGSTHRGPTDRKQRPDDEMAGDTRALRQTTGSSPGNRRPRTRTIQTGAGRRSARNTPARRCLSDPTGHRLRLDDETKSVCRSVAGKRSPRRRHPKSSAVTIRWYRTSAYHTFQAITSFDTPRFPPAVFESDRRLPQPRITHPDGPLPTDIKKIIRKTRRPSSPHSTSEYAVVLYQAGISPVQSSARPQPFEARRRWTARRIRHSGRTGKVTAEAENTVPHPPLPDRKQKNGGHPKQRAPSRKL